MSWIDLMTDEMLDIRILYGLKTSLKVQDFFLFSSELVFGQDTFDF
jgi:hypothetical protein